MVGPVKGATVGFCPFELDTGGNCEVCVVLICCELFTEGTDELLYCPGGYPVINGGP